MILLAILNTIAIIYLYFTKYSSLYIGWSKDTTFIKNTVVAYHITLWKRTSVYSSGIYTLIIPIKNKKKVELREEIDRMINDYSHQNKLQSLSAKFSWLKTRDEVRQFEKDYSIVDSKIVEDLVRNFKPKHND